MFGIAEAIVSERDWNHDASIAMNKTGEMPECQGNDCQMNNHEWSFRSIPLTIIPLTIFVAARDFGGWQGKERNSWRVLSRNSTQGRKGGKDARSCQNIVNGVKPEFCPYLGFRMQSCRCQF